jgi:hypothetical protein
MVMGTAFAVPFLRPFFGWFKHHLYLPISTLSYTKGIRQVIISLVINVNVISKGR